MRRVWSLALLLPLIAGCAPGVALIEPAAGRLLEAARAEQAVEKISAPSDPWAGHLEVTAPENCAAWLTALVAGVRQGLPAAELAALPVPIAVEGAHQTAARPVPAGPARPALMPPDPTCTLRVTPLGALAQRSTTGPAEQVAARYVKSVTLVRNPEHLRATRRVERLEKARDKADNGLGKLALADPVGAMIGMAFGGVIDTFGNDTATGDLQAAEATLRATPVHIEKPNYTTYSYRQQVTTVSKSVAARIALGSGQATPTPFATTRLQEHAEFVEAEGLHPADDRHAALKRQTATPEAIAAYHQRPLALDFGLIVQALADTAPEESPASSLTATSLPAPDGTVNPADPALTAIEPAARGGAAATTLTPAVPGLLRVNHGLRGGCAVAGTAETVWSVTAAVGRSSLVDLTGTDGVVRAALVQARAGGIARIRSPQKPPAYRASDSDALHVQLLDGARVEVGANSKNGRYRAAQSLPPHALGCPLNRDGQPIGLITALDVGGSTFSVAPLPSESARINPTLADRAPGPAIRRARPDQESRSGLPTR